MKKKNKTISNKGAPILSVDGILSTNRAYQPSTDNARVNLGEPSDRADGFYPQRATTELGKIASAESVLWGQGMADTFDDNAVEMKIDVNDKPKVKKTRRWPKYLMFWRLRKNKVEKKQLTKKQKTLRRTGLVLLSVAILGGLFLGFRFWQSGHSIFRGGGQSAGLSECKDLNQLKNEGDCRINVLLLGIGGPGHDGPDLTDTIMIASIDPINNSVALLSIPRDFWVQVPGYGSTKINAAYAYGKQYSKSKNVNQQKRDGLKLLDETLHTVTGININYHVVVDFKAFKYAVNAVGGITVDVPETLYDPTIAWENHNNPTIASKGVQKMDGAKALLYARSRETSSDFARGQRQRAILVAVGNKVLSLGTFSNPAKVSNLLSAVGGNVFSDLSLTNLKPFYNLAARIPPYDITSLDLASSPGNLVKTGNVNGLSVVYPVTGVFDYSQVTPYIGASLRDGYMAKENAIVTVYNATTTFGLATKTGDILRGVGYRVTKVDNAGKAINPATTTIVDLSGGKNKYTRHYLEMRYKTTAVSDLPKEFGIKPPAGADFVIILGKDASITTTTSSSSATAQ